MSQRFYYSLASESVEIWNYPGAAAQNLHVLRGHLNDFGTVTIYPPNKVLKYAAPAAPHFPGVAGSGTSEKFPPIAGKRIHLNNGYGKRLKSGQNWIRFSVIEQGLALNNWGSRPWSFIFSNEAHARFFLMAVWRIRSHVHISAIKS